jgi:glutamate formiminotransferase/formiminotetrahydrofolate cyclodeaminase
MERKNTPDLTRLVECVPNFSEGRDQNKIKLIADAIGAVAGVSLLNVDPGLDTHRTVMTFAGPPEAALEAAFRAIDTAARVIDMSVHKGAHPRIGATDVLPFVPLSGVTMDDCAELARRLGKRVGDELGIPVFLYEAAASRPERKNLADIRRGEYEGLAEKLDRPEWKPDFGPSRFNRKAGATAIGARPFLIAYNVNLNTRDVKIAREIASSIREKGRVKRDENGKILTGTDGEPLNVPGRFEAVKAVGWYMESYGRAQVSINLADHHQTPLHLVFQECCRLAENLGARVTGSELVGLIPLDALLEAGRYFLRLQGRTTGVPESELIHAAVLSLGLAELGPFDANQKIIETLMKTSQNRFAEMPLKSFIDLLSSDAPSPGGGSASALFGAVGSALVSMVAALTHGKKGYETVFPEMEAAGTQSQQLKDAFLNDALCDAEAFNRVLEAVRLPKKTDKEKGERHVALEQARKEATLVPLDVMRRAKWAMELVRAVAEKGNRNSISDAGVAALALQAAAHGAYFNVRINLPAIEDATFKKSVSAESETLLKEVRSAAVRTVAYVHKAMDQADNNKGG